MTKFISCIFSRELSVDEYTDWSTQHARAENALEKRDKLLMESYNAIETKMTLLCATGWLLIISLILFILILVRIQQQVRQFYFN